MDQDWNRDCPYAPLNPFFPHCASASIRESGERAHLIATARAATAANPPTPQNSILRLYNQNTKTLKVCEALEQGKEVVQRDGGGYESIYVSATRNEENGDAESHKMDVLHDGGYEGKEGEKVRNKVRRVEN